MPLNEKLSRRILESINIKNEVSETKEMSEEKQADFRETPNRMKCSNCGEVQVDITMTQEEDITCPMCGKPGLELVGLDSGAGAKSQKRNKEEKEMSEQPENASEIEALKAELDSINMRYEADKIKTEQAHNAILEKKDQTIVSLNKETSKLLREKTDAESELSVLKEKVAETVGELAREKTMSTKKIKDLTAERNSYQSKWMNEKQEHSDLQETVDGLREKAVEWRGRFEDVNEKRNKALEEKVKAERKALNEVKERARYQNECADLREQLAEALDKYSKTSKARFEDSKHILKLQEQIKELEDAQSEWEDRQKGYEESLDAARKRIAWADDKLKKAKIAFVKK
jgi:chromosome segregation ATPase